MPDKENNLGAGAPQPSTSADIPSMVNGHIVAITNVHNATQENNLVRKFRVTTFIEVAAREIEGKVE